jgi:hypothetical protein
MCSTLSIKGLFSNHNIEKLDIMIYPEL